jgi:hypothetical protein
MQDVNLRRFFDAFCEVYAPAGRADARRPVPQGAFKGAPLRCSLRGARFSRPGMLATGEAIGSTYAFSGEGIGKAMETGLLAAQALLAHRGADGEAAARRAYATALAGLQRHASTSTKRPAACQPAPVDHRPRDLARAPQRVHPAAAGGHAGGNQQPGASVQLARHVAAVLRIGVP